MHTPTAFARIVCVLGATAGCALLGSAASARDKIVTEVRHVHTGDLDLTRPRDAQTLYTRLSNAAWFVCNRGSRVDLLPADDPKSCYEKTLGEAVRATNRPLITRIYLATHTTQQAAAYGVELPQQIAAQ